MHLPMGEQKTIFSSMVEIGLGLNEIYVWFLFAAKKNRVGR